MENYGYNRYITSNIKLIQNNIEQIYGGTNK